MQKLYIGLMSGTSMDGIDAVIMNPITHEIHTALLHKYSAITKQQLTKIAQNNIQSLDFFCYLNTLIGEDFAKAANTLIKQSGLPKTSIEAIGSHGQTVLHKSVYDRLTTCQLGSGQIIAFKTGLPVVNDFRQKDILLGGQGAPLAPLYHKILFAHLPKPLAVVNIGGIANISFIESESNIIGYDVGPGNVLLDAWILKNLGQNYDRSGAWAASGTSDNKLLAKLMSDHEITRSFPKSMSKEYFSLEWLTSKINKNHAAEDIQATLLSFTVFAIIFAIKSYAKKIKSVLICGGGVHNNKIMSELSLSLPEINISSTQDFGINPDFIEAQLMAWLAFKHVQKEPVDYSSITGASSKGVYGVYHPCN